ncbi:ComF family protein [Sphingorhabdus sp. Alg239-R122]|uniref:ComF family protein n=1 Tax=Sphingorhabdus sp. Alg239-R122 TaxID=2305989 RepID=UPI0013D93155|nr:ComF family protein [Sphingorhabdus sp. Alg239-R122]
MGAFKSFYDQVVRPVLDIIIPPRCPSCGDMVENDLQFCGTCWPQLKFITDPCCSACGRPFDVARDDELLCAPCLARPPKHDGVRAAVVYDELSRQIPLKLKYAGRIGLAKLIARFLGRHMPDDCDNLLLVPVPLHRGRIWRRGFNQAALIAQALHDSHEIDILLDSLLRTRATPPLKGMTAQQRRKILQGAIKVNPKYLDDIRGRDIMLIDDVYTSGATTNACVIQLKKAGAQTVTIYCWARVLRDGEEGGGGH